MYKKVNYSLNKDIKKILDKIILISGIITILSTGSIFILYFLYLENISILIAIISSLITIISLLLYNLKITRYIKIK